MSDLRQLFPESKSWKLWVDDLSTKAYNTRRHYVRIFLEFLKRWEVDPEELFNLRLNHIKSEDPRDQRVIEGWVKVSMKELLDQGKSASTARMISKAVNSFFEAQNLDFNMRPREQPKVYHNGQRVIMKRQILTLYDRVGEEHRFRNRAILMTLKDSGLRVSDLCILNVGDYAGAPVRKNEAGEVFKILSPVKTVKTGVPAYVHLGPESVKALDQYIEELSKKGEIKPGDPMYRRRGGERLTPGAMSSLIWKLAEKLDESDRISAHSIRKFFQTMMEAGGVSKNWIGKYQGKMVGDSSGPYSQPEEMGLLTEAYMQAYEGLRIFGSSVNPEKIKAQNDRIKELEAEVSRLRAEHGEVDALRAEVEEMRNSLKLIYEELKKE